MKRLIISLCLVFIGFQTFAQNDLVDGFHHEVGTSYHIFNLYSNFQGNRVGFWGFDYVPRYRFLDIQDFGGLCVSAPIALGFALSPNPQQNFLMANVPILAEVGVGHHAHPQSSSPVGAFAGVGLDYSFLSANQFFERVSSLQPAATVGLRLVFMQRSYTFRIIKALKVPQDGQTVRFSLGTNL